MSHSPGLSKFKNPVPQELQNAQLFAKSNRNTWGVYRPSEEYYTVSE